MMLRIQLERKRAAVFPNTREYARYFWPQPRRLALAKPTPSHAPRPMNRGVEIDPAWPRPAFRDPGAGQPGVAIRMAVLYSWRGSGRGMEQVLMTCKRNPYPRSQSHA